MPEIMIRVSFATGWIGAIVEHLARLREAAPLIRRDTAGLVAGRVRGSGYRFLGSAEERLRKLEALRNELIRGISPENFRAWHEGQVSASSEQIEQVSREALALLDRFGAATTRDGIRARNAIYAMMQEAKNGAVAAGRAEARINGLSQVAVAVGARNVVARLDAAGNQVRVFRDQFIEDTEALVQMVQETLGDAARTGAPFGAGAQRILADTINAGVTGGAETTSFRGGPPRVVGRGLSPGQSDIRAVMDDLANVEGEIADEFLRNARAAMQAVRIGPPAPLVPVPRRVIQRHVVR